MIPWIIHLCEFSSSMFVRPVTGLLSCFHTVFISPESKALLIRATEDSISTATDSSGWVRWPCIHRGQQINSICSIQTIAAHRKQWSSCQNRRVTRQRDNFYNKVERRVSYTKLEHQIRYWSTVLQGQLDQDLRIKPHQNRLNTRAVLWRLKIGLFQRMHLRKQTR